MPNDGEGYFTRIAIGLQGALADAEPTTYGFVVEPFVRFGRIADKQFDTVDEVCKVGAVVLPCLAVDDDKFHCVVIDYIVNTRQTNSYTVHCIIVVCKGKPMGV